MNTGVPTVFDVVAPLLWLILMLLGLSMLPSCAIIKSRQSRIVTEQEIQTLNMLQDQAIDRMAESYAKQSEMDLHRIREYRY